MLDLFDYQNRPEIVKIRVTPNAKAERIVKQGSGSDGIPYYKVYVTAVPEDGKANKAVIKLMAKTFNVSKSSIEIARGHTSKDKTLHISYS